MLNEKKTRTIQASLISALAATVLTGCSRPGPTEVRRCVDDKGKELPDSACENPSAYRSSHGVSYFPFWIYGGSRGVDGIYRGFRTSPSDGATVVTPAGKTISRGGFGSGSSSSSSSFGG